MSIFKQDFTYGLSLFTLEREFLLHLKNWVKKKQDFNLLLWSVLTMSKQKNMQAIFDTHVFQVQLFAKLGRCWDLMKI